MFTKKAIAGCVFSVSILAAVVLASTGCSVSSSDCTSGILYMLFGGGTGDQCVKVFDNAKNVNGTATPDRTISGPDTEIVNPYSGQIHIDTVNDELYVASGGSLLVFASASTADGDVPPGRKLEGISTELTEVGGIWADTENDILYVADAGGDAILVFARTDSGNVAPQRIIRGVDTTLDLPRGIFLDTENDRLYVANSYNDSVLVFDNAGTASGNIAPDRTITHATYLDNPRAVHVDTEHGLLFVIARSGYLSVFENADTIDGETEPDRVVSGSNTDFSAPMYFCVDTVNDHIYQVNDISSVRPRRVGVWHNVSSDAFTGNLPPDRVFTGDAFHPDSKSCGVAVDSSR
jgi:DNA-binding beta-propeller fold protein YncE